MACEFFALGGGERGQQVPIRGRVERHPLPLAIDDQPHRDALHAAGRKLRPHLLPQQRRDFIAVQPVDDPPRFLGPHQVGVDLPRMGQRFLDRLFRDLVEHQPMDRHLRLEQLVEMPTDGLAFAVFVRRQIQVFGLLDQPLELADLGRLAGRDDIERIEILVDIHAQPRPGLIAIFVGNLAGPLRQIADVADAGLDREPAAQKLADRAGLGGRLDDHQGFGRTVCGLFLRHAKSWLK